SLAAFIGSGSVGALQVLDLDCNDLQDEGLSALASSLPHCRSLRELRLGGNRLGLQGAQSLAAALARCQEPGLQKLDVSRNYLGPAGAAALAEALAAEPPIGLRVLRLSVNRVRDAGVAAMSKIFQGSERGPLLEELDLGNNMIGDTGAAALAAALVAGKLGIRSLGLSRNKIAHIGAEVLSRAVSSGSCPLLQSIDLVGNDEIGSTAAGALASSLRSNLGGIVLFDPFQAALESARVGAYRIDLSGVPLHAEACKRLAEALRMPKARTAMLVLSRCSLGNAGAEEVATALRSRPTSAAHWLTELDLGWNGIGPQGGQALARLFGSPAGSRLETLELECNDLGNEGVSALIDALGRASR
ncbi:unnamed protein product, partial [Polarella glacialis]